MWVGSLDPFSICIRHGEVGFMFSSGQRKVIVVTGIFNKCWLSSEIPLIVLCDVY